MLEGIYSSEAREQRKSIKMRHFRGRLDKLSLPQNHD